MTSMNLMLPLKLSQLTAAADMSQHILKRNMLIKEGDALYKRLNNTKFTIIQNPLVER